MSPAEQRLFADIERLGIAHQLAEHEAVFTVEQSSKLHRDLPGAHTKNLFLKDGTGRYWLITLPCELRADLKRLPAVIGSKRLSFGNPDEMRVLLGVEPGSVTPLAAINDEARKVTVVIDARLAAAETVNVHPLRNTATVGLAADDLLRLLTAWDHAPQVVEVPVMETEAA